MLLYALQRTLDDLEARAIVAEHHDPELGPISAREYRTDIRRLRQVVDQLAPDTRGPDPEQAAVRWIDGVYTVADGKPVPLLSRADLQRRLEANLAHHRQGLLSLREMFVALAEAVGPEPADPLENNRPSIPGQDRRRDLDLATP